ncbi:regulatory protein RecX [Actinoplanes sp. TFC3]|uniref:regulatory protein RecX n=1 Tax=Actinoplanes sp. TFC3 TaxID=1710355 RepID=UPI000B1159C7|nr:regulatory protein RecX [Actinoplanes sp. TFC3]
MAGRRGARSGRGWDAIPPRSSDPDSPDGEPRRSESRRGNAGTDRRRGSPGESAFGTDGAPANIAGPGSAGPGSAKSGSARSGGAGSGNAGSSDATPRSESEIAREICLRQLAVRPRTRAELAKALTRKEISEEVIAEVLDRYDEVGIIDDAAFARAWVSSRHHGRGLARRALANELRQHGVDAEVATEALEAVDDEAEAEAARALVDRKLRTARGTPDQVFRRLVGMLARKGYPAGTAIRAVKDALAARDAEAAEFADQIDPDAMTDQ